MQYFRKYCLKKCVYNKQFAVCTFQNEYALSCCCCCWTRQVIGPWSYHYIMCIHITFGAAHSTTKTMEKRKSAKCIVFYGTKWKKAREHKFSRCVYQHHLDFAVLRSVDMLLTKNKWLRTCSWATKIKCTDENRKKNLIFINVLFLAFCFCVLCARWKIKMKPENYGKPIKINKLMCTTRQFINRCINIKTCNISCQMCVENDFSFCLAVSRIVINKKKSIRIENNNQPMKWWK